MSAAQLPGRATEPLPIGHGPDEHAVTHVARKRHRCQEYRCGTVIQPGQRYVRATTFSSHDIMGGRITSWKFCEPCATRYGRPLPPVSNRGAKVDPDVVDLVVRGAYRMKLNRRERVRAVDLMTQAGVGAAEIGRRIGVAERTVQRIRARIRAGAAR